MKLRDQNVLFFSRSTQHGGTENVILQLCEIFMPLVNKIIVCAGNGFKREKLKPLGIKFFEIPDIENKNPKTILMVTEAINKIVKDEKITVIHTHHRMAAFYVSCLRLYKKCIFINTSHNTFYNKKILTRFAYKHANIVACGEMVKKNLVDVFGMPDKQVAVIHNAVKPFTDTIKIDSLIKQLHNEGDFIVGNIGRLSQQKGMEYFIKSIPLVIEKHTNARFVIAGNGEDEEKLKALSKDLDVEKYIFFLGYRTDIQNLMLQLDFIVLSSLWEGLPLTPIEAYSVGKTVIGTAVDGTIEIIRDGIDGYLIEPKNSEAIADKINDLITNEDKKRRFEAAAKKRYKEEFSFDKLAEKYIRFYKDIE